MKSVVFNTNIYISGLGEGRGGGVGGWGGEWGEGGEDQPE